MESYYYLIGLVVGVTVGQVLFVWPIVFSCLLLYAVYIVGMAVFAVVEVAFEEE